MGVQGVSGTAVAATAAGGVLVWSGLKGARVSGSLRNLLSGEAPPKASGAEAITAPGGTAAPAATSLGALLGGNDAQNQALGQQMCAQAGWTGAQWSAFNWIAETESSWSDTVVNPSSGAAGIAQNISGFGPGYESGNAGQQIAWMISYIQGRYGTPVQAKAFHQANGWY